MQRIVCDSNNMRKFVARVVLNNDGTVDGHYHELKKDYCKSAITLLVDCYSDHNEDIRTKGSCDYCDSRIWL